MIQVAYDAIAHYLGKGLSKPAAVGIVAVLYVESKLNPGSQGAQSTETPGALNPAGAFGIASWNGPRQEALAAFAKIKALDPAALTTQLDFVLTECANKYRGVWAAIQSPTTTYAQMVTIFTDQYEIPANKPKEIGTALTYANEFDAYDFAPVVSPAQTNGPALTPAEAAGVQAVATAVEPVVATALATAINPALVPVLVPLLEALMSGAVSAILKAVQSSK